MFPLSMSYSLPATHLQIYCSKMAVFPFFVQVQVTKSVFKNICQLSLGKSWHKRVGLDVSFQIKSTFKACMKYLVTGTFWKFKSTPTPKYAVFHSGQLCLFQPKKYNPAFYSSELPKKTIYNFWTRYALLKNAPKIRFSIKRQPCAKVKTLEMRIKNKWNCLPAPPGL